LASLEAARAKSCETVPVQPVDATPSDINLFLKVVFKINRRWKLSSAQRDDRFYFDIFIFGNFRFTAATTAACSGFPELLAKASRA
jgi:hypothetical protein